MTRKEIYKEWQEAIDKAATAKAENIRYTKLGDEIFSTKYEGSFANYDDRNGDDEMDGYWGMADEEAATMAKMELKAEDLYRQLFASVPEDFLDDYESYGNVSHPIKKLVRIQFFSGEEMVGYIYPCESDYCGPPYYVRDGISSTTHHINYGELIESVQLVIMAID